MRIDAAASGGGLSNHDAARRRAMPAASSIGRSRSIDPPRTGPSGKTIDRCRLYLDHLDRSTKAIDRHRGVCVRTGRADRLAWRMMRVFQLARVDFKRSHNRHAEDRSVGRGRRRPKQGEMDLSPVLSCVRAGVCVSIKSISRGCSLACPRPRRAEEKRPRLAPRDLPADSQRRSRGGRVGR